MTELTPAGLPTIVIPTLAVADCAAAELGAATRGNHLQQLAAERLKTLPKP
jgi:hypothetical protein